MDLQSVSKAIAVDSSDAGLGDAFRELAESTILRTAIKHFGQLKAASVHISRDGPRFDCAVDIHLSGLRPMSAEAQHEDSCQALKRALDIVEDQLRGARRDLRESKARRIGQEMLPRDASSQSPII
jgi:ribosome-associated translation inhibitor RaiA